MSYDWKKIAADKAKSLIDNIPKEWVLEQIPTADEEPNANEYLNRILPENEKEITNNNNISSLLKLQEEGKLTAYEITYAFAHRAALIHQLTNCCSEIFFDQAFQRAKELDEYFQKHKKLSGKLHGIPISLKDQINLPGITTAIGYIAPHINEEFQKIITHRKSMDDISLIALILQNQGAVFYVKTTVPMAMLGGETSSNLSTTYNSLDRHTSCGGSSGGEGALIGSNGSIVGLGTDIGGSIRIPSYVHGLYGLRASSNRFPYLNIANSYPNQIAVCSVVGPICKYIEDMTYISNLILSDQLCFKDPKHIPLAWNQSQVDGMFKEKPVKIGILEWDGEVLPHTPITNNVKKVETILKAQKEFDVRELSPEQLPVKLSDSGKLLLSFYNTDNYTEIESFCKLSGEPFPNLFERGYNNFKPGKIDSVSDFCNKAGLKYEYQVKFDTLFEDNDIDCFIIPSYSCVSWIEGENDNISNFYTRAFNPLDYTTMTFPVGTVSADDVGYERTDFRNQMDENNWKYFDLSKQIGKPVSLQLVCKRYREEECCAIVSKITEILKKQNGVTN